MSTEDKLAALRSEFIANKARWFDHWLAEAAESPIERLLLAHMLVERWGLDGGRDNFPEAYTRVPTFGIKPSWRILLCDTNPCICVVQAEVDGPYAFRIDFAFVGERFDPGSDRRQQVRVGVELDGHDFHERTKEQASRDKRRDRILAAGGWTMLRFTGSDVYRDPAAVLSEIENTCVRLCWPHMQLETPK